MKMPWIFFKFSHVPPLKKPGYATESEVFLLPVAKCQCVLFGAGLGLKYEVCGLLSILANWNPLTLLRGSPSGACLTDIVRPVTSDTATSRHQPLSHPEPQTLRPTPKPRDIFTKVFSEFHKIVEESGITEDQLSANRKHVWFFACNLRIERGTVFILTWLSAKCQYL